MNKLDLIQPNKSSALILLGTITIKEGEIYKIRYINSFGHLDCMVGLGLSDGVGPDNYTILSDHRMVLVSDIITVLPDISRAIFGEVYLLKSEGKVFRCFLSEESGWKKEEILGDHFISCISDSGIYLLSDGSIKSLTSLPAVPDLTSELEDLKERFRILEKKVNTDKTYLHDYNSPGKDLVIIPGDYELTKKMTLISKSVFLQEVEISGTQSLSIESPEIEIGNLTVSGGWDRKGMSGESSGNSMLKFYSPEKVKIDGLKITKTSGYNGLEFGLDGRGTLKTLEISDLDFESSIVNNAILVFSMSDGAEIYIHDCHFSEVSNVLRISNATKARGVKVILQNIVVDKWDTNPLWEGLIIMEDYTTKGKENLFGPDNLTIILDNVRGPWGKIKDPGDISTFCPDSTSGRTDGKQVFYVYHDNGKDLPYDSSRYPEIMIE